jgi:hypothetical protein
MSELNLWSKHQQRRILRWWISIRDVQGRDRFSLDEVAQVFGLDEPSKGDLISLGRALSELGFIKQRVVVEGNQRWVYHPNDALRALQSVEEPS